MLKKTKLFNFAFAIVLLLPFSAQAVMSNDPYVEQWGYKDTGVYNAWNKTTGSKRVVVAVVDNGIDDRHPDLADNIWKNTKEIPNNSIDDDKNGYVDDVAGWNFVPEDFNGDGTLDENEKKGNNNPRPKIINLTEGEKKENVFSHATAVAGIIGATGNNNLYGVGLNWKVRLMNLRVVGNSGEGEQVYVAPAIKYAVDNGADIINVSLVTLEDEEIKKSIEYAREKKVAVVAAAGNNMVDLNNDHLYPICADLDSLEQGVLGVTAIEEGHHLAMFSNLGSKCVDITAPGTGINSLSYYFEGSAALLEYAKDWKGTSFSAPFVSGAAALVKAVQPDWRPVEIYQAILSTVHRTPPKDPEVYKNLFGNGLLQVDKAVEYALNKATPDTLLKIKKKVILFSPDQGLVEERYLDKGSAGVYGMDIFKGAQKVSLGENKDGLVWVLEKKDKDKTMIKVYDSSWGEKYSWIIYSPDLSQNGIVLGDVNVDGDDEIIILTGTKKKPIIEVFTLEGKNLDFFLDKNLSASALIGVVSGSIKGMDNIVTLTNNKIGELKLLRYENGKLAGNIYISEIDKAYDFEVADVDEDGEEEYIILGVKGSQSVIAVYKLDGSLRIAFPLGDVKADKKGIYAYDYNDDSRKEILVYPKLPGNSLTVWDSDGNKLREWTVSPELSLARTGIIPLP